MSLPIITILKAEQAFEGSKLSLLPFVPPLSKNEIHIWTADAELLRHYFKQWEKVLSSVEKDRMARFHFKHDRIRFLAAHGLLRALLGAYLRLPPEIIVFKHAAYGKPELHNPGQGDNLQFNLSHSQGRIAAAFSLSHQLGVDVEQIRPIADYEQLASCFFHPLETMALQQLPLKCRQRAFFQYWTGKEALVKGTGEGLQRPLNSFYIEVNMKLENNSNAPVQHIRSLTPGNWKLFAFSPSAQYAGALAFSSLSFRC